MAGDSNPLPPFPLDSGGVPASDFSVIPDYAAGSDLDDALRWLKTNAPDFGDAMGSAWDHSHIMEKTGAFLLKIAAYLVTELAKAETTILDTWIPLETQLYEKAIPILTQSGAVEVNAVIPLLIAALAGNSGDSLNFGSGPLAASIQGLFNGIVQPFTLMDSAANPQEVGSGIKNQQYLLRQAIGIGLSNWVVDNIGDHMGMGFLKTLRPFLSVVEHCINPSNVVRQAMNSSFQFLVRAPLTRDLNRRYPIKDLGVTALAKLYLREVIDDNTYLDKCLDAGLDNTQAQQLLLESMKFMTTGNLADLLTHGYITENDARQMLLQMGYHPAHVDSLLYLQTHSRYFSIQERVGNAAVAAWKHAYIDENRLEEILHQTGFSDDEIQLLELEGEFVKSTTEAKELTYAQIRQLFQENIIGVDDVITFLTKQGYQPDDVRKLVLLDFTAAAERSVRDAELQARLRVQAEQNRVTAAAAAKKNEQTLADAKNALADELDRAAKLLGAAKTLPGILALIGGL